MSEFPGDPNLADLEEDELVSVAHLASPLATTSRIIPGFRSRPHQKVVSDAIVDAYNDNGPRFLAISVPPQFGKSTVTSLGTPIWWMELHAHGLVPGGLVGLVSYEEGLAFSFSRTIRRAIKARSDIFSTTLRTDSKAAEFWETEEGGGVVAVGIAGTLVGRPISLLVIDDPTKNMEQAQSEKHRELVWNFWQSVGVGRLQPWTVVIITVTRWHDDDIIGRLKSKEYSGSEEWRYIRIPAVADSEDDPVRRQIGEPLLRPQANYTVEMATKEMERVEKQVSRYVWSTLWQQNPVDPEGTIFFESKWRYYGGDLPREERYELPLPSDFDIILMSWDMAFKDEQKHDWVVGQAWGKFGEDYFLIDEVRGHWGLTETVREVNNFAEKIRRPYPTARTILVEDKANGPAVVDVLRSKVGGLIDITPEGSKISRAWACQPLLLGGNLYLPAPSDKSWIPDYTKELADFPNAAKDDRVDATTQALIYFMNLPTWSESEMSDVEEIVLPSSIQQLAGRKTRPALPTGIASLRGR